MHIPAVRLVVPLCIGIAVADAWLLNSQLPIGAYLGLLAILLALLMVCHKWKARITFVCGSALFVFTFGAMRCQMRHDDIVNKVKYHAHSLRGRVSEAMRPRTNSVEVTVKTQEGTLVLAYTKQTTKLEIGDFIHVFTLHGLEPTYTEYKSVSDTSSHLNYQLQQYRHSLYRRGIAATCYADSIAVIPSSSGITPPLTTKLHSLQTAMVEAYHDAGFDGDEGALVEAMTTGSRINLSSELRTQYSRAGTSHVLALSGFHLTIIYALLEILLFTHLLHGWWRRGMRMVGIGFIWAFVVVAGAPSSLVRAAIMCTLLAVSQIMTVSMSVDNQHINIRWDDFLDEMGENGLINSLAIAAIIMLIYDPFMMFDVGFQLSFTSMSGLCMCRDIVARIMHVIKLVIPRFRPAAYFAVLLRWVVKSIVGVALTSLICTLFTFPLVAYYFGTIPTMSVVSNILIALPAFMLLVLAAVWWIAAPIAALQTMIGVCLTKTAGVMNGVTGWVASMDHAVVVWHPTVMHVALVYALLFLLRKMYDILDVRSKMRYNQ